MECWQLNSPATSLYKYPPVQLSKVPSYLFYNHVIVCTHTHTHTAFFTGDPHLTNLDGAKFTFNGWGEYILLELETDDTTFWVQARMQPITNSSATELAAFAFAMSTDTPVEVCHEY